MRVLITGIGGFVGRHLTTEFARAGAEVHGVDLHPVSVDGARTTHVADVVDTTLIGQILDRVAPNVVVHLAGAASVGASFDDPAATWNANLGGTLALCEALRRAGGATRLICVTSAEIHGSVAPTDLPVTEETPLRPHSPYAASKAAADIAALQYHAGFGMDVVVARPFNHVGPGQDPRFVVPSIARQIAIGERDGADPIRVEVGNTAARRDFMDVRDVVRAYRLIAERGRPGAAYVIGTGRSVAVGEILERLCALARGRVEVTSHPSRFRPGEPEDLFGSPDRLTADTGWAPSYPLDQTLNDTLEHWRMRAAAER